MKTATTLFVLAGILYLLTFTSCTHEPAYIEEFDSICFNTQVLPILQTSCGMTGCHSTGSNTEEFDISSYQTIMQAVSPGNPKGSLLYNIITDINNEDFMPPGQPLTRQQRSIIHVWIAQGARETLCNDTTGGGGGNNEICFVQDIQPIFLSSCGTTGCHDAITHEEDYAFTDYNSIVAEGIKPFDPNDSKIFEVITKNDDDRMPPAPRSPLSAAQIEAMRQWIADGAKNSDCPENACDTTGTISYSTHVSPVLQANCVGCHNSSLANGGVNLSSHDKVLPYTQTLRNGTPILSGAIKHQSGFVSMPPTFSLSSCNIGTIDKWIRQGAVNN